MFFDITALPPLADRATALQAAMEQFAEIEADLTR
jgi:hypothetical protein